MNRSFQQSKIISGIENVSHLFTTRLGGFSGGSYESFNLGNNTGDTRTAVESNLKLLTDFMKISKEKVFYTKQVHGDHVVMLKGNEDPMKVSLVEADAIITKARNVLIGVKTADCCPVLISDKEGSIVAAIHAGWKGTVKKILVKTIKKMCEFGVKPEDLRVFVGPSIGECCYEVGEEFEKNFLREIPFAKEYFKRKKEVLKLNLKGLNARIAFDSGILESNLEICHVCTSCQKELFYSYRRDGATTGRHFSGIMIVGEK